MKVLFVSHSAVVDLYQDKIRWMAKDPGISISLLIPEKYLEGPRVTEGFTGWGGYKVIRRHAVAGTKAKQNLHWYRGGIHSLVESIQPDLVHLDEEPESIVSRQIIRQAVKLKKQPKIVLFTWRNLPVPPPSMHALHPKRLILQSNESYNLRHSDAMIAGNHEAVELFRNKGYTKPMPVIPQYGIDPERFFENPEARKALRARLGILEDDIVIGFVGRMLAMKGLEHLLRALHDCYRSGLRFRAVLIGSGPDLEKFRSLAQELEIQEICLWINGVKPSEVPEYMNVFDIATIPSLTTEAWKEQFGRVIIEAMACGVPVLGSNSGEIPHVIGNGGISVPEGDVNAWAEALKSLIQDRDQRNLLAVNGKQRVREMYTNKKIAEQTVQIWKLLL